LRRGHEECSWVRRSETAVRGGGPKYSISVAVTLLQQRRLKYSVDTSCLAAHIRQTQLGRVVALVLGRWSGPMLRPQPVEAGR
jgi:hypothetical protein